MASAATRRAAASVRSSLEARSLNVVVRPHPVTFAERRSVLQILKQHGDIETFKMMTGGYDRFITIAKDEDTASSLVAASPVAYAFDSQCRPFDPHLADLSDSREVLPKTSVRKLAADSKEDIQGQKKFTLHIFPAPWYHHEQRIAQSREHSSWPPNYTSKTSFMAATLEQSLPDDIMTQALARWDNNPDEPAAQSAKAERLAVRSWTPSLIKEDSLRDQLKRTIRVHRGPTTLKPETQNHS